jgi:hypothetical protein
VRQELINKRCLCVVAGMTGTLGVVLLLLSFAINSGPPPQATTAELLNFGSHNYARILWGAWLQAVGPVLIVFFAFCLVHLGGATQRLAGWMTFFGATILMTVSLVEITFYISALHADPSFMPSMSLVLISAVQHLYFMVAAPALFLPLGIVLLRSAILPSVFAYTAIGLSITFASVGAIFMLTLTLPAAVTALGGIQGLWWLAAAITLALRGGTGKDLPSAVNL